MPNLSAVGAPVSRAITRMNDRTLRRARVDADDMSLHPSFTDASAPAARTRKRPLSLRAARRHPPLHLKKTRTAEARG